MKPRPPKTPAAAKAVADYGSRQAEKAAKARSEERRQPPSPCPATAQDAKRLKPALLPTPPRSQRLGTGPNIPPARPERPPSPGAQGRQAAVLEAAARAVKDPAAEARHREKLAEAKKKSEEAAETARREAEDRKQMVAREREERRREEEERKKREREREESKKKDEEREEKKRKEARADREREERKEREWKEEREQRDRARREQREERDRAASQLRDAKLKKQRVEYEKVTEELERRRRPPSQAKLPLGRGTMLRRRDDESTVGALAASTESLHLDERTPAPPSSSTILSADVRRFAPTDPSFHSERLVIEGAAGDDGDKEAAKEADKEAVEESAEEPDPSPIDSPASFSDEDDGNRRWWR